MNRSKTIFRNKTLTKNYLLKVAGKVVETPQHMFMRVALGIHGKFKLPPTGLTAKLNKIVQELIEIGVPEDQLKAISIKLLEIATGKSSEFKLDEDGYPIGVRINREAQHQSISINTALLQVGYPEELLI